MANLTVVPVTLAGLNDAGVAAAGGGDAFDNDGQTYLRALNGSGGSITLTLVTPATVSGLAVADPTVAIPAGESRIIGPFPKGLFNDTNGRVGVTYSGVTSLTVKAMKFPAA